jgi:hypothetical protein
MKAGDWEMQQPDAVRKMMYIVNGNTVQGRLSHMFFEDINSEKRKQFSGHSESMRLFYKTARTATPRRVQ